MLVALSKKVAPGILQGMGFTAQNRPRILVKVRSEEFSLGRIAPKKNFLEATHESSDHQYAEKSNESPLS